MLKVIAKYRLKNDLIRTYIGPPVSLAVTILFSWKNDDSITLQSNCTARNKEENSVLWVSITSNGNS